MLYTPCYSFIVSTLEISTLLNILKILITIARAIAASAAAMTITKRENLPTKMSNSGVVLYTHKDNNCILAGHDRKESKPKQKSRYGEIVVETYGNQMFHIINTYKFLLSGLSKRARNAAPISAASSSMETISNGST